MPHRCAALPAPTVPKVLGFGFDFSQAISSAAFFGGKSFLPTIHNGAAASNEIGCKSFSTS